jgi:serine/threonine-protein kinase
MRFCPACHGRYDDASRFCPRDGEALPVDAEDERIGTVLLGQFELLEVCGKGAMGTVYRAWQTGMERQVAIKVLRPELLRDPTTVARFDREARLVAKLQHPNIVTFFLVGETEDHLPFLAMEYVEGESLAELLEEEPVVPVPRALHVARQVCSALADAHAEGIVHRDLKPANLLLTQKRRMPDFVKVLDFGIAKILRGEVDSSADLESRLTRTGTIFGTPHYIAPEQAAGGAVDGRADLYSLGVILYRCVTGKLPFDGAGINVMLAHMGQEATAPRVLVPDLDPRLDALIRRAMEKDPAARFQSAEELADALEALGARTPEASPLPSSGLALPRPAADGRASASVELLGAAEGDEDARPPRRRLGGWLAAALGVAVCGGGLAAVALSERGAEVAPPVEPAPVAVAVPVAAPAPAPLPVAAQAPDAATAEPDVRPGYRVITVGESGYAVRVQVPADPRVGPSYAILFDVIDPDGSTTDDPELPATIEEPGVGKRSLSIHQVGARGSGRYVLERSFASAGRYHVHLYPIPEQPKVHIWFEFVVKDELGRVAPAPAVAAAPHGAHAAEATARPLPPILGNLGAKGAVVARDDAAAPTGGVGESDPYHIIEDGKEAAGPDKAGPVAPDKAASVAPEKAASVVPDKAASGAPDKAATAAPEEPLPKRPRGKRPRPARPNPDGLE